MKQEDLNKVTFFVGPNGSGKSVTAKELAPALHMYNLVEILYKEGTLPMEWVNKWLNRFSIPTYKEIVDGFLKEEDFNSGTLHMLELICSVCLNREPVVWVEHPEYSLYPMLQSHLANFFLDASDEFGTKFIVETHSEYMIRRSQVIAKVCEQRKLDIPFTVYCFPKESEPYKVIYSEGRFNRKFERGFYDETSCLAYQLI